MLRIMGIVIILVGIGCGRMMQNNSSIPYFKNSRADPSHIYSLPFEENKNVLVVQGYKSWFSHRYMMAIDFKVKKGTRVCAARNGVVIAARKDSYRRGLKKEFLSEGNYVFIQHDDGSVAHYWHFDTEKVFVKTGDTVKTGQVIGLSGNTGYSAFPHLHFDVSGYSEDGRYGELATRFYTQRGIVYLVPGKFYKRQ